MSKSSRLILFVTNTNTDVKSLKIEPSNKYWLCRRVLLLNSALGDFDHSDRSSIEGQQHAHTNCVLAASLFAFIFVIFVSYWGSAAHTLCPGCIPSIFAFIFVCIHICLLLRVSNKLCPGCIHICYICYLYLHSYLHSYLWYLSVIEGQQHAHTLWLHLYLLYLLSIFALIFAFIFVIFVCYWGSASNMLSNCVLAASIFAHHHNLYSFGSHAEGKGTTVAGSS